MHSMIAFLALAAGVVAQGTGTISYPFITGVPAPTGFATGTVTVFTTVCPTPTTFVCDGSTYAVSTSTTLTVHCPGGCAISTPVTYNPPAPTMPANTYAPAPPAATTPASPKYTGAADKLQIGGALVVAAIGALAL